jgi:hypothetical protein
MRLMLRLKDAMDASGVANAVQLEKALGLTSFREKVPDLLANNFQRISRRDLHALLTWAFWKDVPLLDVAPHPLWRTFPQAPATLFFDDIFNAREVQGRMIEAIERRRGRVRGLRDQSSIEDIRRRMKTENCVFLGGPVKTPKSEAAYSFLCGAEPFDESPANRAKLEVIFTGCGWSLPNERSSWALNVDEMSGCGLRVQTRKRKVLLPVTRYRDAQTLLRGGRGGIDAGVLVACRRPLGTDQEVTTIILAGMSSVATRALVDEMIWETADFPEDELPEGTPVTLLLRLPFTIDAKTREKKLSPRGRMWFPLDTSAKAWNKIEPRHREEE